MMTNKKVCIIGAGIGGLASAVLLTKKGYKVTVFEKEPQIGGRALSFKGATITVSEYKNLLTRFNMGIAFSEPNIETIFNKKMLDNYVLDLGFHILSGGVPLNIKNLLAETNNHINFLESYLGFIEGNKYKFPFLSKLDKLKIAPNILRLLYANEKTLKELDKVSISDTIKKYGKGKMKLILEVFSRSITTMNNLDKISSGEMLRAQKNLYKGSKPVAYPKKGLISINNEFSDFIIKNGGEIKLNTYVDQIIIKDKKAIGIKVQGKEKYYDKIISNILVQDLFNIINEKNFPIEYTKYIKSLKGTGSLCAYYSLKKIPNDLIGKSFHFLERDIGLEGNDAVGMIDFMVSSSDSGLSPKEEYLVQSYIICNPDEALNHLTLKKLRELLDKNLKVLIPDYKKQLIWVIYPVIWHLDGVAKTIDKQKPDITTPIENLYLVGDCVKAPGIGINCALNSAKIVTDIIQKN